VWKQFQIDMFRPIRVDHTNCLQVDMKTHSFIIVVGLLMYQIIIKGELQEMLGNHKNKSLTGKNYQNKPHL
jgi:hypothetical protein